MFIQCRATDGRIHSQVERIMSKLKDSFIRTDKKEYIGLCNNSYKPDSRKTMCVSVKRLKKILKAFEENDQPYVYLHIDDWESTGNQMLRIACRWKDDCNMIALAKFIVADYGEMKVTHNNNLLEDVADELGLQTYNHS